MTVNRVKFWQDFRMGEGQSLVTDELAGNHREDAEARRTAKEMKWCMENVKCKRRVVRLLVIYRLALRFFLI